MTHYSVYWTDCSGRPFSQVFTDMAVALSLTQSLRNGANRFIVMACETTDMVGELGVDAVVDGRLPSGDEYTWKKRRT